MSEEGSVLAPAWLTATTLLPLTPTLETWEESLGMVSDLRGNLLLSSSGVGRTGLDDIETACVWETRTFVAYASSGSSMIVAFAHGVPFSGTGGA